MELYPGGQPFNTILTLPDSNAIPQYTYGDSVAYPAGVNKALFNNLDETSEIELCDMYFTPFAEQVDALRIKYGMTPTAAQLKEIEEAGIKAGIVYEAKANPSNMLPMKPMDSGLLMLSPGQILPMRQEYCQMMVFELPFGNSPSPAH